MKKNTNYFVVDKVIELTRLKYEEFAKNLLTDFDFIEDNTDFMYIDTESILHTILIKEEGKLDVLSGKMASTTCLIQLEYREKLLRKNLMNWWYSYGSLKRNMFSL